MITRLTVTEEEISELVEWYRVEDKRRFHRITFTEIVAHAAARGIVLNALDRMALTTAISKRADP